MMVLVDHDLLKIDFFKKNTNTFGMQQQQQQQNGSNYGKHNKERKKEREQVKKIDSIVIIIIMIIIIDKNGMTQNKINTIMDMD